jgi:alginate O-acetyltransferase complex protein AlgI
LAAAMTLTAIALMTAAAILAWLAEHRKQRPLLLLLFSVLAWYGLHPENLLFPTATFVLIGGVWWSVQTETAWIPLEARKRLAFLWVFGLIGLFILLKLPNTAIGWIGFSYVAFRLLHVVLDFRNNRTYPVSLATFTLYASFFPAIAAGPIARLDQFLKALEKPIQGWDVRLIEGGTRIGLGLFKKFVLADSLAFIALTPERATAFDGTLALWLMVYAYTLRLFFDFSGYVDMAIGIGILAGIRLPENFNVPYTKRNITEFWNNWHITLSTWFRLYVFTPLSRALLATPLKRFILLVILISQLATMMAVGLWHGLTINFVLWGAWHGFGLWAHKVLRDRTRGWDAFVQGKPPLAKLVGLGSWLFTFHYVAVGWVFFALTDIGQIGQVLRGLFRL